MRVLQQTCISVSISPGFTFKETALQVKPILAESVLSLKAKCMNRHLPEAKRSRGTRHAAQKAFLMAAHVWWQWRCAARRWPCRSRSGLTRGKGQSHHISYSGDRLAHICVKESHNWQRTFAGNGAARFRAGHAAPDQGLPCRKAPKVQANQVSTSRAVVATAHDVQGIAQQRRRVPCAHTHSQASAPLNDTLTAVALRQSPSGLGTPGWHSQRWFCRCHPQSTARRSAAPPRALRPHGTSCLCPEFQAEARGLPCGRSPKVQAHHFGAACASSAAALDIQRIAH